MKRKLTFYIFFLFLKTSFSSDSILNVYVWGGEIPTQLIHKFEKSTGIKVNFSTYDSNEVMFAKLKTSQDYDVVLPSSYIVEKLARTNKLLKLDYKQIPNAANLNPFFMSSQFHNINLYAIPYTWGATGIFYNKKYYKPIQHWSQLWSKKYKGKLLLLDDAREAFAVALLKLGFSINSKNIDKIYKAYLTLIKLQPNIKLLSTNTIQGLIIDDDLRLGVAWNGDIYKAKKENPNIEFVLPKEGFAVWVDCLAILKSAPHKKNAYRFVNFLFEEENGAMSMMLEGMPSTNFKAYNHLPAADQNSSLLNPPKSIMQNGILITDIGPEATKTLINYWQKFKLSF